MIDKHCDLRIERWRPQGYLRAFFLPLVWATGLGPLVRQGTRSGLVANEWPPKGY